ncbi:protein FAM98B [Embiotoca jacksoni]|uniref:protein FAM98B n=1 Tax=Embiotoca jacksoni TaxID=100190 RepID=UPI0037037A38
MDCDIFDCLEQLGYDGPLLEEKPLLRAAEGGLSSPDYVDLCRWLSSRLKPLCGLEGGVTSGPDDSESLREEMSGLLAELHCPYGGGVPEGGGARSAKEHLQFLLFLSSELQAAQIARSSQVSEKQQQQQQHTSPAYRELRAICETLKLPEPRGQEAAGVLAQVQRKAEQLLEDLPDATVGDPALKKPLDGEQWAVLRSINAVLSSEYECRRKMLIKRLDVTVQSFGWSDRAKVKVDSMAKAYQPKRHALKPQSSVDVARLLAAREDVCNVVKTSSGSSREKTTCAVNKVLMGRVPDRGGRPSEIVAPPPEMPPWQKRQGGGGWGGRGGGAGRGGRGGGGGGGWRNQGGNGRHGGHGGKRGRYQY